MKKFQSKQPFIIAGVLGVAFLGLQAFLIYGPSISKADNDQIDANMGLGEFVSIIDTFDISPERKSQILNFLSQPETGTAGITTGSVTSGSIASGTMTTGDIASGALSQSASGNLATGNLATGNIAISGEMASGMTLSGTSDIASGVIATGTLGQDIVQDTSIIDTTMKDMIASGS